MIDKYLLLPLLLLIIKNPGIGASTESGKEDSLNFHMISKSELISDRVKPAILAVLEQEVIGADQLESMTEDDLTSIFTQRGVQIAVLEWHRQLKLERVKVAVMTERHTNSTTKAVKSGKLKEVKAAINRFHEEFQTEFPKPALSKALRLKRMMDREGKNMLMDAASTGHADIVQYLLSEEVGANPVTEPSREAPIHAAAQRGHFDVVKVLLEAEPKLLGARDALQSTALTMAAKNGHLDIVELMVVTYRAEIDDVDDRGCSAMLRSAMQGSFHVTKFLLDHGANKDLNCSNLLGSDRLLNMAAQRGSVDMLRFILGKWPDMLTTKDEENNTALHSAVKQDHLDAVKYLIEQAKAPVDAPGFDGETPLHQAARYEKLRIFKYLVEVAGANLAARDINGYTVVHLAAIFQKISVLRLLIDSNFYNASNVHIDVAGANNKSPLMTANSLDVAKLLLKAGADPFYSDIDGRTALHYHAHGGRKEIVRYLCENYPKLVKVKSETGKTAADLAFANDKHEIYVILTNAMKKLEAAKKEERFQNRKFHDDSEEDDDDSEDLHWIDEL